MWLKLTYELYNALLALNLQEPFQQHPHKSEATALKDLQLQCLKNKHTTINKALEKKVIVLQNCSVTKSDLYF
jgi:hypothetical protein